MKKTLTAIAGASMVALSAAAFADQPVVLSEQALDGVTAAGFFSYDLDIVKVVTVDKNINLNVFKNVGVFVDVNGVLADAEAAADCFGFNCLAETETLAQVDTTAGFNFAEAYSQSIAAWSPGNGTTAP